MKKANFPHEAIAVIDDILQYGRTKHAEGSWRSESVKHHVEKAKGHIQDWLYEVDRGEDHLACALTRMAMALAVRTGEQKEADQKTGPCFIDSTTYPPLIFIDLPISQQDNFGRILNSYLKTGYNLLDAAKRANLAWQHKEAPN